MTSEHHHSEHEEAHSGPDTVPAITGLIVGAILLFALLSSIVVITTKHYEAIEKPAAAAQ